jgi:hypothetical protein
MEFGFDTRVHTRRESFDCDGAVLINFYSLASVEVGRKPNRKPQ